MCQYKKKTLIGGFKHLTSGNRNHESLWILSTNAMTQIQNENETIFKYK